MWKRKTLETDAVAEDAGPGEMVWCYSSVLKQHGPKVSNLEPMEWILSAKSLDLAWSMKVCSSPQGRREGGSEMCRGTCTSPLKSPRSQAICCCPSPLCPVPRTGLSCLPAAQLTLTTKLIILHWHWWCLVSGGSIGGCGKPALIREGRAGRGVPQQWPGCKCQLAILKGCPWPRLLPF